MTLLYRILGYGAALTVLCLAVFYAGVEHQAAKANGADAARLASAEKISSSISANYAIQRSTDETYYATLHKETPSVATTALRISSPLAPVAAPGVDLGFISVWNRALVGPLSDAAGEPLSEADAARPSTIDAGSLLDNHITNAERCVAIEQQLDGLITWHLENDK